MDSCTPFNVLSLCSGVGGLDLGVRLAVPDARTVCYVEREAYCCAVLVARMQDGVLDPAPVWTDLRTFDGRPWRGVVDCVTGGYPCQPFSCAGKKRGADDPRHLWPHVARVVRACRPGVCFFENVANHLRVGFGQVHADLRRMGYRVAAGLFTAAEVGAPHRRERLFVLAALDGAGRQVGDPDAHGPQGRGVRAPGHAPQPEPGHPGGAVADAPRVRGGTLQRPEPDGNGLQLSTFPPGPEDRAAWAAVLKEYPHLEPAVCRVAHGMAHRVDRLRAAGNGVVPEVAALAWQTLTEALKGGD